MLWLSLASAGFLDGTEDQWLLSTGSNYDDDEGLVVDGGHDLNGDGFADVLVGAPATDVGKGVVYAWWGHEDGVSGYEVLKAPTRLADDRFGDAVASPGDVDGDGSPDVVVAASGALAGAGAAVLFTGGSSLTFESTLKANNGQPGDGFGWDVAPAGDVDGDGYMDVVVGAPLGGWNVGEVWVFYGGTGTLKKDRFSPEDGLYFGASVDTLGDLDHDGGADLIIGGNGLDESNGTAVGAAYVLDSDGTLELLELGADTDSFASFVVGAGDLNGDGEPDAMLSDPYAGPNDAGEVTLLFGDGSGLETSTVSTVSPSGPQPGDYFGHGMDAVGDINLDGYDDIVVSAFFVPEAQVFHGSSAGVSAKNVLEPADNSEYWGFGYKMAGVGDVNGDGHPDLVAGTYGVGAYLFLGCVDTDGDGVCLATDCDDTDKQVGVAELLYKDADADGFGDEGSPGVQCAGVGWTDKAGDCDDGDEFVHPGAAEAPGDNIDQDCNGWEVCYVDADSDGFTNGDTFDHVDLECPGAPEPGECDDQDGSIYPGAVEVCGDAIDQDCDGEDIGCEDTGDSEPVPEDTGPEWSRLQSSGGCSSTQGSSGALLVLLTLGLVRRRW